MNKITNLRRDYGLFNKDRNYCINSASYGLPIDPIGLMSVVDKLDRLKSNPNTGKIQARVGSLVTIFDIKQHQESQFELVNPEDAAPNRGRLSILSPLGSTLLGLKIGDQAEISLFNRAMLFEIRNIIDSR